MEQQKKKDKHRSTISDNIRKRQKKKEKKRHVNIFLPLAPQPKCIACFLYFQDDFCILFVSEYIEIMVEE